MNTEPKLTTDAALAHLHALGFPVKRPPKPHQAPLAASPNSQTQHEATLEAQLLYLYEKTQDSPAYIQDLVLETILDTIGTLSPHDATEARIRINALRRQADMSIRQYNISLSHPSYTQLIRIAQAQGFVFPHVTFDAAQRSQSYIPTKPKGLSQFMPMWEFPITEARIPRAFRLNPGVLQRFHAIALSPTAGGPHNPHQPFNRKPGPLTAAVLEAFGHGWLQISPPSSLPFIPLNLRPPTWKVKTSQPNEMESPI
jgi:hypothetical protein